MQDTTITDVYVKLLHSNLDLYSNNVCVLAVDLQDDFRQRDKWSNENLDNARTVMCRARKLNVPIIHIKYSAQLTDLFISGLEPKFGEHVIPKKHDDGFKLTNLDYLLKSRNIEGLYMIGGNAGACVQETFDSAISRNYKVTIISDALMAKTEQSRRDAIGHFTYNGAVITDTKNVFLR